MAELTPGQYEALWCAMELHPPKLPAATPMQVVRALYRSRYIDRGRFVTASGRRALERYGPTEPQRLALIALEEAAVFRPSQPWLTPAEIGYAMTPKREWPLKPQGAGRIGGGMAKRLIARGYAMDVSSLLRGGFAAYRITAKGIRATASSAGKVRPEMRAPI